MLSFLHSADWQIGKPYARVKDPDKRARLHQVRLEAIAGIGRDVQARQAAFHLVAGDLFDSPTPSSSAVSAVCQAIGNLAVPVLVIPGNHDHGAPGSVWHSGAKPRASSANWRPCRPLPRSRYVSCDRPNRPWPRPKPAARPWRPAWRCSKKPGERYHLTAEVNLQVGPGGVRDSTQGGDQALLQAQAEQLRCRERLRSLKAELGVATSDAAETIERQRRDLDAELTTLRKAAAAIPWAGLQERITAPWPGRPTWPLILRLPICCSRIVPAWSGHCRTCTAPVPA